MINSQVLIIHKFPILFNILNEINNYLNFKLENINDAKFIDHLNNKNLLIISGDIYSQFENQIKIDTYPININKLLDIINIQFLKNSFNKQNNIKLGKYIINLNSRMMNFKNTSLSLTEKETKIIDYLNRAKKEIKISKLQSEVWGHKSNLETHTVETHVYRLRKKVEKKFNDRSFILSLKNGYKIKN